MNKIVIIAIALFFVAITSNATNYYIDYENGSDSNDGLTTETAWQHCPGDANATNIPDATNLVAGDIVYFKGGVSYLGEILIQHDGEINNPIIYKGDGWGNEKAIINGADELNTTWKKCSNANECKDNPNFNNIYYTTAPEGFDFFAGFYENDDYLWFSQDPNPNQRYNYDNIESFYEIPLGRNFTLTELTDSNYFKQTDPDYWNGSYMLIWHEPNITYPYSVTGFNSLTYTISFDTIGGGGIYDDRSSYFSVLNHIAAIDEPGEYAFDASSNRIYVWPKVSDDPNNYNYSYRTRHSAIRYNHRKNLIIEGFEIKNFVMGIRSIYNDAENVIVRNNWIKNLRSNNGYSIQVNGKNITIQNNRVENCMRSVGILVAGENIIIDNNYVKNTSRQGIWFMGVNHGSIINNTVTDILGTHSNGISAYLYNENILIAGNQVLNSNIAFTFHGNRDMPDLNMNLVAYNNFFENDCHSWGVNARSITLVNNIFKEGFSFHNSDTITKSINNIFHAGGSAEFNRNNIYTDLAWNQSEKYGWSLQEGEIDWSDKDINKIFVDIDNNDFRLKENSCAVDSGINPIEYLPVDSFPEYNFYQDIFHRPRPKGNAWDIGPYEFSCRDTVDKTVIICEGEEYAGFSTSGIHFIDDISIMGCDSITRVDLMINPALEKTVSKEICEGESYFAGGLNQTETGTYYDTLQNVAGCDSIITTNLIVNSLSGSTIDTNICEGNSYFAGGYNQTEASTYYDTLQNTNGCDSIVVTNLTIIACYSSINDINDNPLKIYPNPANSIITIESQILSSAFIEIYNLSGMKVLQKKITANRQIIDISACPEGMYVYKIFSNSNQFEYGKLTIKR